MAFHLHLIDLTWDVAPATAPQLRRNVEPEASAESCLFPQWYVADRLCLQSRWTHGCD